MYSDNVHQSTHTNSVSNKHSDYDPSINLRDELLPNNGLKSNPNITLDRDENVKWNVEYEINGAIIPNGTTTHTYTDNAIYQPSDTVNGVPNDTDALIDDEPVEKDQYVRSELDIEDGQYEDDNAIEHPDEKKKRMDLLHYLQNGNENVLDKEHNADEYRACGSGWEKEEGKSRGGS